MATGSKENEAIIPDPPSEDWELNILLDEIAREISDEELKRLKSYFIGGPGKRTLSEIKDCYDLFTHLRQTCRLTRDNTIVLQSMLFHLRRRDLHKKVMAYTKALGNALYFYPASERPENGYQHVKMHVRGTSKFDRNALETLREKVARLLCIPTDFVIVDGIEPANSVLITFAFPAGYGDILLEMDDSSIFLTEGVDLIEFEGKTIDLINLKENPSDKKLFCMNQEMQSLTKKIEQLKSDVDDKHVLLLKTERENRWYKTELSKLKDNCAAVNFTITLIRLMWLYNIYIKVFKPFERLSTKAACAYFHAIFAEAQKLNYDRDILRALIEANSMVIKARVHENVYIRLMSKDLQLAEMASRIQFLQYEKEKLAYYLNIGEKNPVLSEREEFWLLNTANPLSRPVIPISGTIQTAQINIPRNELEIIFSKVSKSLKKVERIKLTEHLSEREKKMVNKSPNTVLMILWDKEVTKTKGQLSLVTWIQDILNRIDRQDLVERFHELVQEKMLLKPDQDPKQHKVSKSPGPRKSPGNRQQRRRRYTVPGPQAERRFTDSEQSSGFGDVENESESSLSEFRILSARMTKIESHLEKLVSANTRQEYAFSTLSQDAEKTLSSISSFIPKHSKN